MDAADSLTWPIAYIGRHVAGAPLFPNKYLGLFAIDEAIG